MEDLKIVYLKPDEITPYEKNARKHGEEDVSVIKRSIEENGFCDPIGVWGKKNIIVEGHGRLLAAKELGLDRVPCIRLDHLTEDQRKEYALVHNKSAELSGWDFSVLEEELEKLGDCFNMIDFGFPDMSSGSAIDELFAPIPEKETEEDKDEPKKVQCPHCKEWFVL